MGKYEAVPWMRELDSRCDCGESIWVVVSRRSDGLIGCGSAGVAKFVGTNAEKDAKCHAAKLNERESGPASPGMSPEDAAKLVEEGEAFVAEMDAPVKTRERRAY